MHPQGRVGDIAYCAADAHGCPACAHPVSGPATAGSADVLVNGRPALRKLDPGIHAPCCGANTWQAAEGAPYVLINDRPAFRRDDPTTHCGGNGHLVVGSPNVLVGDLGGRRSPRPQAGASWIEIELVDEQGNPIPCEEYLLEIPDGSTVRGWLDSRGFARVTGIDPGTCKLSFPRFDRETWGPA